MDDESTLQIELNVPFPTTRLAEVAYHVLRVDKEHKRSGVTHEFSFDENILKAKYVAREARHLRVAVNGFFDNIRLICETIEFAGEPTSSIYEHFSE